MFGPFRGVVSSVLQQKVTKDLSPYIRQGRDLTQQYSHRQHRRFDIDGYDNAIYLAIPKLTYRPAILYLHLPNPSILCELLTVDPHPLCLLRNGSLGASHCDIYIAGVFARYSRM